MKLLSKTGEFDDKVQKMKFYEIFLRTITSNKLIPVLSNKYMSLDEKPAFYKENFAEILKVASGVFPNLAHYTDDKEVLSLMDDLGHFIYKSDIFVDKINRVSKYLSTNDRADLVILIANNYKAYFNGIKPSQMPSIFIGPKGGVINSKIRSLLPPERSKFQLPEDMKITFISQELFSILKHKTNIKNSGVLADKLNCFNIQAYSFDNVISKIVSTMNKKIRKSPRRAAELIPKMVQSIFQIYLQDTESDRKFPDVTILLLTRSGHVNDAKNLYFGDGYPGGGIMEALYAGIDESVFIAKREELGFDEQDDETVEEFLKWIGVAQYPRIEKKKLKGPELDNEYEDYVFRNLKYPYKTSHGELYLSYEELRKDITSYQSDIYVDSIKELDDILNKAGFEDILTWLYYDNNLRNIIETGFESPGSSYGIWFQYKQQLRKPKPSETVSYLLWKLGEAEWVKTKSGRKVKPNICCLSKTLIDMSPLIEVPAFNIKYDTMSGSKIKYGDLEHVLTKLGASKDFSALSIETIYAILSNLEKVDHEGKKAGTIYRHILEGKPKEWASSLVNHPSRIAFAEHGKMLSRLGNKLSYFPVKDVFYVDNISFCKEIIDRFPLAQIGRRSGKDRVREIFAVKPLEDIRFSLLAEPDLHSLNSSFAKAFESFKPYILVFRLHKATFSAELNYTKRLKVSLCKTVSASYQFNDIDEKIKLNPYEHIKVGSVVYLLLDHSKEYSTIEDLKSDDIFCECLAEIISEVLKVGENYKDYYILFGKSIEERNLYIQRFLDDSELENLKLVKEQFYNLSDKQKNFWQCLLEAKGISTDLKEIIDENKLIEYLKKELLIENTLLKKIYENIYYDDYSSSSNLPYFKHLFKMVNISITTFNQHSPEQIDFTTYFDSEIMSEKYRLQKQYKSFVYNHLKSETIKNKEKFIDYVHGYENLSTTKYNINNELTLDKERYFNMLFDNPSFNDLKLSFRDLLQQDKIALDSIYNKNSKHFEKKLNETGSAYAEDIESFFNDKRNKSLLYFGESGELISRFEKLYSRPPSEGGGGQPIITKKKTIRINGKEEEYEEDQYEFLLRNIDEDLHINTYEIIPHEPQKPNESAKKGTNKGSGSDGGGGARKNAKEIGLLGEYYVYKTLIKIYSFEKVFWVSEYAKTANINPEGSDMIGYDLSYLDEYDRVHYVEVKSSKDDDYLFSISNAEIKFGERHGSDYEVILVLNVLDHNRTIRNIGNIFDYKADESFNSNDKFIVETDGFKIRFQ